VSFDAHRLVFEVLFFFALWRAALRTTMEQSKQVHTALDEVKQWSPPSVPVARAAALLAVVPRWWLVLSSAVSLPPPPSLPSCAGVRLYGMFEHAVHAADMGRFP
jgi:hypothetical protein